MEIIAKLKNAKIVCVGNSHGFRIPKALLDTEVVSTEKRYEIILKEMAFLRLFYGSV